MERVNFKTMDDVTIVGNWVTAPTTLGAVILLHTMPETRKSWLTFQNILAKRGLASLAIDLRGHGESLDGPGGFKIDYQRFTDGEHQSSLFDALAAVEWIKSRGHEIGRIAVVGASIGANLAVQLLREEPQLKGAGLLSAGKNYRGLNAVADVVEILPEQSLWITASETDDPDSFKDSQDILAAASSAQKEFVPAKDAGHGTKILENQPALAESLADWLKQLIQGG